MALRFKGKSLARLNISQFSSSCIQSMFCARVLFSHCRCLFLIHLLASWFTWWIRCDGRSLQSMVDNMDILLRWGRGCWKLLLPSSLQPCLFPLSGFQHLTWGFLLLWIWVVRWPGPESHFNRYWGQSSITVQVHIPSPSFLPKILKELEIVVLSILCVSWVHFKFARSL